MEMPLGRPNCFPLFQKFSVLIENLYAIVVAIGDEEPSLGIDGDGVGSVEPAERKGLQAWVWERSSQLKQHWSLRDPCLSFPTL